MKKIISAVLAAALIALSAISAFAAPIESAAGSQNADVKGKYINATPEDVYSVDVSWGAMEFDYYEGDEAWNKVTHKWEKSSEPQWTVNADSNKITLANHSSKQVNATFAFNANSEYSKLNGSFTAEGLALESALVLEMPKADQLAKNYEVKFMPSGSIPATHSSVEYAKMGGITVTLG